MKNLNVRSAFNSGPRPHKRRAGAVPVVALLGAAAAFVLVPQSGATAATATSPLIGHLDSVTVATGEVVLHGWAADLSTPHIATHIRYTVGTAASGTSLAQDSRPDVGLAYPSLGTLHGFNVPVYVPPGSYPVCATINEPSAGPAKSLGCLQVTVPADHGPLGHLDTARSVGGSRIEVTGWTFAPDAPTTASTIGIYVGGPFGSAFVAYAAQADQPRPDVASVFPSAGPLHGFDVTVAGRPGTYPVCVYGNNNYIYGAPLLLGCLTVTG